MRTLLCLWLLIASSAFAATPTISSASVTSGVLTVVGTNFDSKTNAAPFFSQDYLTNNGATDADLLLGYANQRAYQTSATGVITVDTSGGVSAGHGALKMRTTAGAADYFPHMALDTSNHSLGTLKSLSADTLYISFWMKNELLSGTAGTGLNQVKALRAGSINSLGDDYYTTDLPMEVVHFWPYADQSNTTMYQEFRRTTGSSSGIPNMDGTNVDTSAGEHFVAGIGESNTSSQAFNHAGWNFVEVLMIMNTPGTANGTIKTWINGVLEKSNMDVWNTTTINARGAGESSKHFDFLLFMTGLDIAAASGNSVYQLSISEHYVDTTQQRVRLGNASTLAATTGGLLAIPSAWTAIGITAAAANIPSGYNWVYVTNSAGETNSSGFALSSGTDTPISGTAASMSFTGSSGSIATTANKSISGTAAALSFVGTAGSIATGAANDSDYGSIRRSHLHINRHTNHALAR